MPKQDLYRSAVGEFAPTALTELIGSRGIDVVRRVGVDVIKDVIKDVLCGKNLRDSTEMLTRRRIGMLNATTLVLFMRGLAASKEFVDNLPSYAIDGLANRPSKQERWLLQWILGLTGKGVQNVLRDSSKTLTTYRDKFVETTDDIVRRCTAEFGPVAGTLTLGNGKKVTVDWKMLISLFCTIGSQTLAIRGSEKSTYGKLFERLILGSVLEILGFSLVKDLADAKPPSFMLSRRIGARESDAVALLKLGQAIRFDIGFIGRGNPEISKDKVSRFERHMEIGRRKYYVATFVIVDRIGEKSRIVEQAKAINGTIIQMSLSYWPRDLARRMEADFGYQHELSKMPDHRIEPYIRKAVKKVRIERFVEALSNLIAEESDDPLVDGDS